MGEDKVGPFKTGLKLIVSELLCKINRRKH